MTLREGLRAGGKATVAMMFVLAFIDELPRAIRVLAPDIQDSLNISDTVLFGILGFGGVTLVLGAVPMAALADRVKRVAIIPVASAFWGVTTFLSGLIVNPFQLFLTNAGTGFGQAYRIPISNSLLVDTYPIQSRSRIFALEGLGRPAGQLLGPLAIGGIAALVGGDDPWRAAFFAVAAAPVVVAIVSALVLREPARGRFEKEAIFGDEKVEVDELPVSMGTAFARLRKIRTFYFLSTAWAYSASPSSPSPSSSTCCSRTSTPWGPLSGEWSSRSSGWPPLSGCPSPAVSSTGASAATRAP